jgi:hypothetical protein
MIQLDSTLLIKSGTNRACYVHPHDKNKCIKVVISGNPKESNDEMKYLKLLEKRSISWDMLARFYGTVETNYGIGEVVELIRDYDGEISKELVYYLSDEEKTKDILNPVILLHKLKKYILKELIIVKDIHVVNIVYQKFSKTDGRLVIIDGTSNNEFIPISTYISYFTRKKINKKWIYFKNSIEKNKLFKNNRLFHKMLKENPL